MITRAMEVEIVHARSGKSLARLNQLSKNSTILDVKKLYLAIKPALYADRQAYRTEPRGKLLKDEDTLEKVGISNGDKLYFKDLGPQVSWTTVFLVEYAGPLVIYLLFYMRPSFVYGARASGRTRQDAVNIACWCWTFHYAKRLLETLFVHRFSHATMPIRNIVKNSFYYWGFAAFVAYFVNHPLYTKPAFGNLQLYGGLAGFVLSELGNLSIHISLRNLRPPGTKVRRIPYPTANPFTWLFNLVSCPNYTYEACAWLSFTVLAQSLPAGLFMAAGLFQMAVWALGKHRSYCRDFSNYPRSRRAIIPFVL